MIIEVGYAQKVAKKGLQSYIPQERKTALGAYQASVRRRLEAPHDEKTSHLVIKILSFFYLLFCKSLTASNIIVSWRVDMTQLKQFDSRIDSIVSLLYR
jgi:hypothetical protein